MRAHSPNLLVALLGCTTSLAACSGDGVDQGGGKMDSGVATDGSSTPSDGSIDTPTDTGNGGAFALTSPTITAGGTIPLTHVCTGKGGMDKSPQLMWTNPPAGTLSFAVVLTDLTNNLKHAAIYDIPSSATGLPADVDKVYSPPDVVGAHNAVGINGQGWAGPCPPNTHQYQLKVFALNVATLPNTSQTTDKDMILTKATAASLGTATLTATFTP